MNRFSKFSLVTIYFFSCMTGFKITNIKDFSLDSSIVPTRNQPGGPRRRVNFSLEFVGGWGPRLWFLRLVFFPFLSPDTQAPLLSWTRGRLFQSPLSPRLSYHLTQEPTPSPSSGSGINFGPHPHLPKGNHSHRVRTLCCFGLLATGTSGGHSAWVSPGGPHLVPALEGRYRRTDNLFPDFFQVEVQFKM